MTAPTEEGTVELEACPFCGCRMPADGGHEDGCYFSALSRLKAAPDGDLSDAPEVLAAWNRRASRSPVVGAVGGEPTEEQKDAARYRWLRNRGESFTYEDGRPSPWAVIGTNHDNQNPCSYEALDAAIDAAMGGIGVSPTGSGGGPLRLSDPEAQDDLRAFLGEVASTSKKARDFLMEHGFITADGRLHPDYGGEVSNG